MEVWQRDWECAKGELGGQVLSRGQKSPVLILLPLRPPLSQHPLHDYVLFVSPMLTDPSPKDVLEIDWPLFGELCRALALRVSGNYDPELVLGIAKAGVIPGAVVASILQRDFASMAVTRLGSAVRPTLVTEPPPSVTGRRVLLVDETCDSGDTLKLALSAVKKLGPAEVLTAVSLRTGRYEPDYCAMATESFIILPWDREVIVDGELVIRPDYAEKLGDAAGSHSDSTDS